MCNSLWPHVLQHARLLCPPLSPGICSSSCLLSQWWYLTLSSYAASFSFCLQSFPAPGFLFPMSQFFASGGQSWSFSFSISPSNEYSGLISFRIDRFDLLAVQGTLKSLFQHDGFKESILWCSALFMVLFSHPYMTTGKTIALTRWTFVGKVVFLLFNMLSRFVIVFLPKNRCLWISKLLSPSTMIFEPKKRKPVTVSTFSLFAMKWWDWMPWS